MTRRKINKDGELRSKVVRGRRGSLQNLPAMPVDILVEIMLHLRPLDILHLSRTNKAFRKFLMTRASEFIWKRARENVPNLPPCPEDLNEPAYANLVFDTHCHECLASGVRKVLWELRVRYCPSCRGKKFMRSSYLVREYPSLEDLSESQLSTLFPSIQSGKLLLYYKPEVEAYVRNLSLPDIPSQDDSSTEKGWRARPEMQPIIEHAELCAAWSEQLKDERNRELEVIRKRRYKDIMARLEALGWDMELEYLKQHRWSTLVRHPRVTEPKDLTDKAWERILPSLTEVLERARADRLKRDLTLRRAARFSLFMKFYAEWRHAQGSGAILPQAIDFVEHNELREIVLAPEDNVVTEDTFNETLLQLLPTWAEQWREKCRSVLVQRYTHADTDVDEHAAGAGLLALAATVWICRDCLDCSERQVVFHYPEVMEHRCFYEYVFDWQIDIYTRNEWEQLVMGVVDHRGWDGYLLAGDMAHLCAVEVVQACKMDPAAVTTEEMDRLDIRLTCKACQKAHSSSPIKTKKVFSWRAALQHYGSKQHAYFSEDDFDEGPDAPIEWECVGEDELRVVKDIEESAKKGCYDPFKFEERPRAWLEQPNSLCCAYCPEGSMSIEGAEKHVDEMHYDHPIRSSAPDYYRDKSLGPVIPSPIMLITEPNSYDELEALRKARADDPILTESITWFLDGRAGRESATSSPANHHRLLTIMARRKADKGGEVRMKVVRGRRGSLQNLPAMPVDILVEILSHLRPLDILHISRTNKAFRKFLMARASEFIWKRARENVPGLPPCPEDLSEPSYANLAFDTHCHECLASGVKMVLWEFRARYCPSCRKEKFWCRAAIVKQYPKLSALSVVAFDLLFPSIPYGFYKYQYYMPTVRDYARKPSTEISQLQREPLTSLREKDWRSRPELQAILKHAALCEEWCEKLKAERSRDLQAIRTRRYEDIQSRLRALEWGPELDFLKETRSRDLTDHPHVTESKELTDKAWEKILPSLIGVLEKARADLLKRERVSLEVERMWLFMEVYAMWREMQGPDAILPQAVDIARHDELRDIILAPQETVVMPETFEPLQPLFRKWAEEWRESCRTSLAKTYPTDEKSDESPPDTHVLDLAATAWTCKCCSLHRERHPVLQYPEVLEHGCLNRRMHQFEIGMFAHRDEWEYAVRAVTGYRKWTIEPLIMEDAHTCAVEVIRACGMDPATVTREEMDKLDVRLTCKGCWKGYSPDPVEIKKIFSWRAALRHYMEHDESHESEDYNGLGQGTYTPIEWERVADDQMSLVKRIEESARDKCYDIDLLEAYPHALPSELRSFCCSYCPKGLMDEKEAEEHVDVHLKHLESITTGRYHRDKSAGPIVPSPIVIIVKPNSYDDLRKVWTDDPVVTEAVSNAEASHGRTTCHDFASAHEAEKAIPVAWYASRTLARRRFALNMPVKRKQTRKVAKNTQGRQTPREVQAPKRRQLRGRLKNFSSMPLDIVEEIFSHLEPLDFLMLMRTCKTLRRMISDRGNSRMWVKARANVPDLPPCPEHLSEPEYASFMFERHCMSCTKKPATHPFVDMTARYCKQCVDSKFTETVPYEFPPMILDALAELVPYKQRWQREPLYHFPDLDRIHMALAGIEGNLDAQEDLVTRLKERRSSMKKYEPLLREWLWKRRVEHEKNLEVMRQARVAEITSRLQALGYGDVLDDEPYLPRDSWRKLAGVNIAEELTERSWDKLKPGLMEAMAHIRERSEWRRARNLVQPRCKLFLEAYDKYLSDARGMHPQRFYPTAADILLHPQVRKIMLDENQDVSVEDLIDQFPSLVQDWITSVGVSLLQTAAKDIGNLEPCDKPLEMAHMVFTCKECQNSAGIPPLLHYPALLWHPCCHEQLRRMVQDDILARRGHSDPYTHVLTQTPEYGTHPLLKSAWSASVLAFDKPRSDAIQAILRACGRNPMQHTRQHLNDLDELFRCQKCLDERSPLHMVMDWRAMLNHHESLAHAADGPRQLQCFKLTPEARRDVNEQHQKDLLDEYWKCPLCDVICSEYFTFEGIARHLNNVHGVENVLTLVDVYKPSLYISSDIDPDTSIGYFIRDGLQMSREQPSHLY
ncbi:hypothetical protein NM688_g2194 [Phlebia brevispora]|uniref:Uncharacterized protein n=1 Tax=Phlebia brevispora TaxID=194682 RepID=A0ACC1T9C6_9APHY|nr:hypothetical protein NM688_g2194 [Phlebia brevispora]